MNAEEPIPEEARTQFAGDADATEAAWEEVAEGRYMPRRFKGSYRGRALG